MVEDTWCAIVIERPDGAEWNLNRGISGPEKLDAERFVSLNGDIAPDEDRNGSGGDTGSKSEGAADREIIESAGGSAVHGTESDGDRKAARSGEGDLHEACGPADVSFGNDQVMRDNGRNGIVIQDRGRGVRGAGG